MNPLENFAGYWAPKNECLVQFKLVCKTGPVKAFYKKNNLFNWNAALGPHFFCINRRV